MRRRQIQKKESRVMDMKKGCRKEKREPRIRVTK